MYPREYIEYLVHFHSDRDYFECHEILEEYWKKTDPGNKESILVGFILLAVSNYHQRRGNVKGAIKTLQKAISIFIIKKEELSFYGLDSDLLIEQLDNRLFEMESAKPYTSMNLPIIDHHLEKECIKYSQEKGTVWCKDSDLYNLELIHKHSRRDRNEVILERQRALRERQNERKTKQDDKGVRGEK